MADFVFNIAKGMTSYYGGLPATNDAFVVIPIEASGVEADSVLRDYDNVSVLLAAATNEQTTMGRKTITSVTVTVDDTNDRVAIDTADVTWTGATGNAISDLLLAYDGDTTGGTDANLVPMSWHDFSITPDGSDVTATVTDWIRSS
ncbi:hypothetical protein Val02_82040 [Virgisporangium aliadipatigenens]|uniref:Uncharacterized protein n=1 Tax=Virgisporangium aliadipatigenens TaxID=741659 RepID=A0A8J3YVK0_9ACTN|nr:hypothetical protein [Virgisporangium aliadipatigenens]GIJ51318.1 hypothetical protein Val02_82040 [Virgisporangium aliadipatigenens]